MRGLPLPDQENEPPSRPESWEDRFTLHERRLVHGALGLAVVLAMVVIPGFSVYVCELRAEGLAAWAATDGDSEGSQPTVPPEVLVAATRQDLEPRQMRKIARQLGLNPDLPPQELRHRLQRYAQEFARGRFDSISPEIKQMALERFGPERLKQMKEQFQRMNLSPQQMVEHGMRELQNMP